MEIVVINLFKDKFKRLRAVDLLSQTGFSFSIFNAINGRDLSVDFLEEIQNKGHKLIEKRANKMSAPEIGLYLSHIEVIKAFLKSSNDFVCILEDDFQLSTDFVNVLNSQIFKDNIDYDVLMLGHFLDNKNYGIVTKFNCSRNRVSTPLEFNYGTHAYIISRNAAHKILKDFSVPLCPFDHILGLCELYGLKRLVVSPPIVKQDDLFTSSVQTEEYISDNNIGFYFKRGIKFILFNLFPSIAFKRLIRNKII